MLAIFGGSLALLLGLLLLLLPLLVSELSRPRDSVWGAVVLLLGLVLVTSADRLTGAPMLGVLCGGLLIGRLGLEVGQGRWRALSDGERQELGSKERWQRSLEQLLASLAVLLQSLQQSSAGLLSWWEERRRKPAVVKRWVRAEESASADGPASDEATAAGSSDESPAAVGDADNSSDAPSLADHSLAIASPAEGSAAVEGSEEGGGEDSPAQAGAADEESPVADRPAEPPAGAAPSPEEPADPEEPGLLEVSDFTAIEELLSQAPDPATPPAAEATTGGAAGEAG